MSLLFTDSFDGVLGSAKWDMLNGTIHTDYGRHGTKGLASPSSTGVFLRKVFNAATNRVVVGGWSYIADVAGVSDMYIFQLESPGGSIQLRYRVGEPRFTIAGTGIASQAIGEIGSGQPLTWHFVELMWEPGVAAEVRVNGQQLWAGTPGGSGTPFRLQSSQGGIGVRPQQRFDDIYLLDSSGSANNDFLGPIKIVSLKPDGAGNRTELTATPAGNNWERVSDGSDATYVEGDSGDGDLYTFDDLSSSDDVLGVVQYWRAFDSEGGGITGRAISRVGGTEYDGDAKIMPGSVATHVQPWDVSPDTGQPWTPAEVNGAEFGVEFA